MRPFQLIIRFLPVVISAILIAAHFLRDGNLPLVAISLVIPLFLFFRRPVSVWIVKIGLWLATSEWLLTVYLLVSFRMRVDLPWIRMALILGGVAAFTLASTLVFHLSAFKKQYKIS